MRPEGTALGPAAVAGPAPSPRLSIVLATLNERSNLPEVLARIRAQPLPAYEIIVIDDGSVDGTREFVRAASAEDLRIRLLSHEGRQTTLRAQCQAIEASVGEYVAIMDADLQHPPELLPALVEQLDRGAALSIASRYVRGGSAGSRTAYRWAISRGAEWLTKLLLPPARGIADPVSGYFAFRRAVWVPLNPLYRGYKLLIFVLVMAEGLRVAEVGFRFTPRGEGASKVTGSTAFFRVFATEVILARRLRAWMRRHGADASPSGSSRAPMGLL